MSELNRHLLLVEDEESLGYLLSEYLSMKGYKITWAKNGEEALDVLKREDFDLAILDVMMPKMNGYDVCNTVKNEWKLDEVKVVILTARGQEMDIERGVRAKADDYMTKPFDPDQIVEKARSILGSEEVDLV